MVHASHMSQGLVDVDTCMLLQIKLTKEEMSEIEACFPEHEIVGERYPHKELQYQRDME